MPAKHPALPLVESPGDSHCPKWRGRVSGLTCLLILAFVLVSCGYEWTTGSVNGVLRHHSHVRRSPVAVVKRETLASGIEKAPVPPRLFNDTVESIKKLTDEHIATEKIVVNRIIENVTPDTATFENTMREYLLHENQNKAREGVLLLYSILHPNQDIAGAASHGLSRIKKDHTWLQQDFFNLVDTVYKKQWNDPKLDGEDRVVLQKLWGELNDAGLNVSAGEKRMRFKQIDVRLNDLMSEFDHAIIADKTTVWFTPEELNGTNSDVIASLDKGDGKNKGKVALRVGIESAYDAVMGHCTNATTRYRAYVAYANQAPSNVKRLEEAVALRDEKARLLNYDNFATEQIQKYMAKTPKAVDDFLKNIQNKVTPTAVKRLAYLKDQKQADVGKADHLFSWDVYFYETGLDETEYKVDNDLVTEYFPATTTMQAILDLYAQLFGLRFVRIDGKDSDQMSPSGNGSDLVWHPDVELYAVWNDGYQPTDGQIEDDGFVGYLYLDLFYREGKQGSGAFEFGLDNGFEHADGSRYYPATVLVTTFQKSNTAKPSLLQREEVQTIMHELGHGMHQLTSRVKYSRDHGPEGTPPDFFEAPSQMMENFAYVPAVLQRLSRHWSYLSPAAKEAWMKEQNNTSAQQPAEKFPEQLANDVRRNKNAWAAIDTLSQLVLAMYDMALHEPKSHKDAEAIDSTSLYYHMKKEITTVDGPEVLGQGWHWGHRQAIFSHIMDGYEAGYYSYLWSQVYCVDLFYTGFKPNPFSREAGTRFRRTVLEPGGTKDLEGVLEEFLGHKPSDKAFFEDMGIHT